MKRLTNVLAGYGATIIWGGAMFYLFPLLFGPRPAGWPSSYPWYTDFFFACIAAPLWEELAFRHLPLTMAKQAGVQYVLPTLLLTSIFFGYLHGGVTGIMMQGVLGLICGWVYLRNGYHYWSSVSLHFGWNLFCLLLGI